MTENKNRCVVTGLGLINAIGNNVEESWSNALKSVSGIKNTTTVDTKDCYATLAAEVSCDTLDSIPGTDKMDRVSKLCIKATLEAMEDAGYTSFDDSTRVSVIMGSCVGGAVSIDHYYRNNKPADDVVKMPISAIAANVAEYVHAGGVVTNVANACAAGTISIAYACDLIRAGKADIVIAGGADAFASVPYAGFLALHALDANPCSPFNKCSGITLGEGSGAVIVESYEHALKRKAKMYCEVLGSGVSTDAHHITAPREDGEGQMNAINWAIETSGVKKDEIGYINAHGTGTAKNDNAEFLSLHTIFDNESDNLSVSSTKAMVGHCLGAAGAIEAVFAIKALTENKIPATVGYDADDLERLKEKAGKIDFVPNKCEEKELNTVMSNSFAFGGNNASIIFSKKSGDVKTTNDNGKVYITGLGIVTPFGNTVEDYIKAVEENKMPESNSIASNVVIDDYVKYGLKPTFRKHDNLSHMQVVSGMEALKNANITVTDLNATSIGIVEGSADGALGTCLEFTENIVEKGCANGSAFKFPNTVYNAAGGYLSIVSGIKGYNVTLTNSNQSGLQSVAYGANIIRQGKEKYVLATGTDENIEGINEVYNKLGVVADSVTLPFENKKGFTLSDGSVTVILENDKNANERGAKKYAEVLGYGMACKPVEFGTLKGSDEGLVEAINLALADANLKASDIDTVSGFACGYKEIDDIEINALNKCGLNKVNLLETKLHTGEARAASAALALAEASLMLAGDLKCDKGFKLDGSKVVSADINASDLKNVLCIAYGAGGSYSAVIITK
ncbi:MAG: beta-ketoacyl-[acyl-carrier-protein] synthase family protein [Acholeplasmatales bacterium]|nr:beta-ketoacyl-[acyl-carrier-protein] synthase family protein [Acholeplasmatales bacterium]